MDTEQPTTMPGAAAVVAGTLSEESWENHLESFRVDLTRVLMPERYFDIFRSKAILDERDCQEIGSESIRPARAQKAGYFLDIIGRRGRTAFNLLMDCLEADHPDLFTEMTGKEPRSKPPVTLPRRCSCDCHEDRISLDLIQAYKLEKENTVALKQDAASLKRALDKANEERHRFKHEAQTLRKEYETWNSEREELTKLRKENLWQREQICALQAKAFDVQNQLIQANDNNRKIKLENNALKNKVRETEARLSFHRKKSTRLEQEKTESDEKMKEGETLKSLVNRLQLELQKEKIKVEQEAAADVGVETSKLYDQTKMDIMLADKQEAVAKCEEAVRELHDVRIALYDAQAKKGKLQTMNEELEENVALLNEELDMVTERLQMAQDELEQVSGERSQAIEDRNQAIEETAKSMLERDVLVIKLNQERTSFMKKSRQLFECRTKLQRKKREVEMMAYQDRPASVISTDGSSDTGSKRSSAAADFNSPGDFSCDAGRPASSEVGPAATVSPSDTKRSISHVDMKHPSIEEGEEEEEDRLSDYEFPVGTRPRVKPVTESNSLKVRRLTNSRSMDGQGSSAGEEAAGAASDQADDTARNTEDQSDHWPNFESWFGDTTGFPRTGRRGIVAATASVEVHVGSLKDKNRNPAPRISSCDYPGADYMRELTYGRDRRSQTIADIPDSSNTDEYPKEDAK